MPTVKYGRWKRKQSNLNYKNSNARRRNKMRRITQSSGEKAALAWDAEHGRGRPSFLMRGK